MDERSPYAPPLSDIEVIDDRKGSPWKAILLGLLVDVGGTVLLGIIVTTAVYVSLTYQGVDQANIDKIFATPTSPLMLALSFMGGLLSLLGGYVCASIAKHNELKIGGVMAFFSTIFGFLLGNSQATPFQLLLYAATVAAILFGSWLGMKRNHRHRKAA